ncbi:MAG: PaRep2b protein [Pyrobaculum sp.]
MGEGYYDEVLKPVYKALGLQPARRSPAEVAEAIAKRIERAEAPAELKARALEALRGLASTGLDDPALYERAVRSGDAVLEVLAYAAGKRLEDAALLKRYDGEELLKAAEGAVRILGGLKPRESLPLDVAYRLVGRDSERALPKYLEALGRGRVPEPEGAALVFYTTDEEVAARLARRFPFIRAAGASLVGRGAEAREYFFFYHPALEPAVNMLKATGAGVPHDRPKELAHLGFAPAEFAFAMAGVRAVDVGGVIAWREGKWNEFLNHLKSAVVPEWPSNFGEKVREVLGKKSFYDLHLLFYIHVEGYREFLRLRELDRYDENALVAYLAALAAPAYIHWVLGQAGERSEAFELLRKCDAEACLYALSDMSGIDLYRALARARGAPLGREAGDAIGATLEWVKFILGERMAPPARKSPYLELAAWLVATARGEPYEKVLAKAVEELKRTSLPPGFKIEDEEWWVKKAEEPGRERPGGEARPAGEAGGGKTAGKAAEERRVGRAGGEALRGEETKLRGEQREVRGERPGSKGEEAAQAKPASEAAGVVKQTAGAGPEGGVGAAGFIPPGLSGLSAAGWLAGVEGRVELSREAAWALRERVRKAVEKAKARHMPRLYRLGGGALVELAEEAAGRVLDVVFNAVDSPGALRRIAVLLEGVEEVLFEGRGSGDAEALFGWVRGYLERAGDSAWEVWQFVYSTARAAVDAALAFYDDVYKGIATVETALKTAAVAAAGLAGFAALHDALHATAVFSATATAIALAGEGAYEKAVEYVKRAAEAAYEAAREIFEKAKIALERLYELFLEAVARALDYVRAHWLILAATAAGLVSWMAAQQLDFSLWQDHVARFAPLIAGVPAFKEFKTALDSKAPELLDAAEEALRRMSEDAVDRLFEKAREAVGQSSRLWADFRKAVRSVEARGRGVKPEHAAVAWALLEAGLKELGGVVKNAAEAHRRAVEGLVRGEEVELPAGDIAAFVEKTRDVAHRLGLLFERIAEKAEKYGSAEAVERAFTVTELAGKLAEASTADLGKLGEATLADKVVAFFESLAEGATWSRVVLNALERGEAYGALIRTPRGASDKYGAGSGGEYAEGGRLGALVSRLAHWLAELGIGKATARRVGDNVEISADGKTIAEVGAKAVRREEGGEESVVFRVKGELAGEVGKKAAEMAERMEPGGAERYQVYALLATDGGYKAEGEVYANTTSVLQAALYRRLGMEVSYAGEGNLTKDGFKPVLTAKLSKERGGREVVEAVRRDLEDGLKKLWSDEGLREELRGRVLKLLSEVKISTRGAGGEEGLQAEEVRARLRERIEKFLTELRLGEGGAVCLVNCQFGEQTLTYSDEPHARVVAPLLHYIAQDAPVEEVGRFMAYALLFDGHVRRDQVYLVLGNFHVKEEEGEGSTRRLPLDVYDKVALYIVLAAKYGVGISRIYLWKDAVRLHFDGDYAARIFASAWHELSPLWKFGVGNGLYADHVYKKLGRIKDYVEAYADRIKIAYELYSQPSGKPGVRVMFKDEKGNEIAHINIWWDGKALYAKFSGARERAERLASILNALGAEAEVRKYGGMWYVLLTTDSITAIRRGEWLNAVRTLVEELYRRGVIDGEKREKLLREINAGPNVVEVAGVELSVNLKEAGKYKWLDILYQPRSAESFNATVKALKDAGFEEGVHFTTRKPEGSERGHIRLKLPAGLWRLEELRRQGVGWAEKALRRLEEIGRARGFSDLLEEYLRPAREAETVDPRGITTEVKDGVKAVVRDVKVEWEDQRPRITVEYEAGGDVKSLSLLWGVGERGRVRAGVWLDVEKAAVLATLTGDESIRGKRGKASLSAHHLLALARLRGVGWDLLRWYAEVMRE